MNSPNIAIKRLMKEYQKLKDKPVKNIFALPNPDNIFEWHFILYDLDSPYTHGYYHGKLIFPTEYPNKPPNLIFLTPNGRFKPQEKICLSFTGYHPETWSISWGVENMLVGLISFMYTDEITTGAVITSSSEKIKLAGDSLQFNIASKEFVKMFQDSFKKLNINVDQIRTTNSAKKEGYDKENDDFARKVIFFVFSFLIIIGLYFYLKGKFYG